MYILRVVDGMVLGYEFSEVAFVLQQLCVRPTLHDCAVLQHDDVVHLRQIRQAVGHEDAGLQEQNHNFIPQR